MNGFMFWSDLFVYAVVVNSKRGYLTGIFMFWGEYHGFIWKKTIFFYTK